MKLRFRLGLSLIFIDGAGSTNHGGLGSIRLKSAESLDYVSAILEIIFALMAYTTSVSNLVRRKPRQNGSCASRFSTGDPRSLHGLFGFTGTLYYGANSARPSAPLNACLNV